MALVGRHAARLAIARQVGVDHVFGGDDTDVAEAVAQLTDGQGTEVVVECVGRPAAWQEALSRVRGGGEILMFGGCERGSTVAL